MHRRRANAITTLARAATSLTRATASLALGALALAASSSLLAGCRSAAPAPLPREHDESPTTPDLPFVGEPLSWRKLESMESWLDSPASRRHPETRREIVIQLNEGRVFFAERDVERADAPQDSLRLRLEAARDGFKEAVADGSLQPGQRARAQIGLQKVETLLDSLKKTPPKATLAVITRARWGALPASPSRLTPLKGAWSRITVHHSAETSSNPDGGSLEDSAHTLRLIQKFHLEDAEHRWGDIGYHYLIDSAGRIFEGRELKWQGAHAGNKDGQNFNPQNIGVCLLGDFKQRSPTPASLKSLELLIKDLREKFRIPASRLFAHVEFTGSECPGPFLTDWVKKRR